MDGKDYQRGSIEKAGNRQRNNATIQDEEITISRTSKAGYRSPKVAFLRFLRQLEDAGTHRSTLKLLWISLRFRTIAAFRSSRSAWTQTYSRPRESNVMSGTEKIRSRRQWSHNVS